MQDAIRRNGKVEYNKAFNTACQITAHFFNLLTRCYSYSRFNLLVVNQEVRLLEKFEFTGRNEYILNYEDYH